VRWRRDAFVTPAERDRRQRDDRPRRNRHGNGDHRDDRSRNAPAESDSGPVADSEPNAESFLVAQRHSVSFAKRVGHAICFPIAGVCISHFESRSDRPG